MVMRTMLGSEPAAGRGQVAAQRFHRFEPATQQAIVRQLRATSFPEGFFPQVPSEEWLRLLWLTDPLIYCPAQYPPTYQLIEGGLLLLLVSHYLEVL